MRRTLTHAGDQRNNAVTIQERLEAFDLVFVDSAFGQDHHVNAVDFLTRGENHAAEDVQIESFRGYELEQAERLFVHAANRALHGAEVGLSHSKWPRQ